MGKIGGIYPWNVGKSPIVKNEKTTKTGWDLLT
jgi:hypothetical protein